MGQLEVLFEIPRAIEIGLASGQLERIGGVIVDSQTRQIVTWLRDSPFLETAFDTFVGSANPLGTVLNAAQTAASLYDNHLTRQAINALTTNISMMATATITGQILNLALTATSFQAVIKRLDNLSAELDRISKKISDEFNRERDMRFRTALQTARDVFESENKEFSRASVRSAINGLYEARENLFTDFYNTLDISQDSEHVALAQQYLIRAFYAETSRIQCYLQSGDKKLAVNRLREDKHLFQHAVNVLIKHLQGKYPAVYFHKDVPSEYLERFLNIEQWKRSKTYHNNPRLLFEIIDDLRKDFWNEDVLENNIFQIVTRRGTTIDEQKLQLLANNLLQTEILIENLNRLDGFELEISELRLSIDEWESLVDEQDLKEHGVGVIVDVDYLQRLETLSAYS